MQISNNKKSTVHALYVPRKDNKPRNHIKMHLHTYRGSTRAPISYYFQYLQLQYIFAFEHFMSQNLCWNSSPHSNFIAHSVRIIVPQNSADDTIRV